MELWRLLAHSHWVTLKILGYDFRVCSRCSGYTLGLMAPLLVYRILMSEPVFRDVFWYLVCFFMALPLTFDWLTQSWRLRSSNNLLRFLTGFLLGLDLFIYSKLGIGVETKILLFIATAFTVSIIGSIGKLYSHKFIDNI